MSITAEEKDGVVRMVTDLAEACDGLEDLCGEMLATLRLNLEKKYLRGCSPLATAEMEALVEKWQSRFEKTRLTPIGETGESDNP